MLLSLVLCARHALSLLQQMQIECGTVVMAQRGDVQGVPSRQQGLFLVPRR